VIDAETNKLIVNTPRGGGASKILMAALESNELVSIGPAAMEIAGRDKCRASAAQEHETWRPMMKGHGRESVA
jgi:hypothetical protein